MKRLPLFLMAWALLTGCWWSQDEEAPKPKNNQQDYEKLDSIIDQAKRSYDQVARANQESDTMIQGKVEKTAQKISGLETQVQELKQENSQLKNEIKKRDADAAAHGAPFRLEPISNH